MQIFSNTPEQFAQNAKDMILEEGKKGRGVVILIHTEGGIHFLSNAEDPLFHFGILDIAKLQVADRLQEMTRLKREESRQTEKAIASSFAGEKENFN